MIKKLERTMAIIMLLSLMVVTFLGSRESSKKVFMTIFNGSDKYGDRYSSKYSSKCGNKYTSKKVKKDNTKTVVIDPGHGGYDPGKIGINGELEKDVNLKISLLLREMLEEKGINVIMTRDEDVSLCDEDRSIKSKKASDMGKRIEIVNEANADLLISIHQNSYPSEKVKGAQVFYYQKSEEGRELSEKIQSNICEKVDEENRREAKDSSSYYLLLRAKCTAIIVECGFLSNWEESVKLCDEAYQRKISEAISEEIIVFLQQR